MSQSSANLQYAGNEWCLGINLESDSASILADNVPKRIRLLIVDHEMKYSIRCDLRTMLSRHSRRNGDGLATEMEFVWL